MNTIEYRKTGLRRRWSATRMGSAPLDTNNATLVQRGFTIVELLIVIVVIAILAAISIVAYSGMQDRARTSAATTEARGISEAVAIYAVDNDDNYPASLNEINVEETDGTTYQYRVNNNANPKTWCATVTVDRSSVYVSNEQRTPREGACAGHGSGGVAPVVNLVPNPSAETGTSGFLNIGNARGRTTERINVGTASARSGSHVFRVTQPTPGENIGGYGSNSVSVPTGTYTASLWVRSNQPVIARLYLEGTSSRSTNQSSPRTLTPNTWTRFSLQFDVTSPGTIKVGWLGGDTASTSSASTYVDMDAVMLTEGGTLHEYADGDSQNWIWNGTPHASTSTGPPL